MYDNPAYIKKKEVKTVLDDFEHQRFLEQFRKSGFKDRAKYIRALILRDLHQEETVPQRANG